MSDRPDQHTSKQAKRGHLQLVETSNVEDVINEVFDDGRDENEPMPWDVAVEDEPSAGSLEPQSYRNRYGLTGKQESFCREMLTGCPSASEAYRRAYNVGNMSQNSIGVEASRLMANPRIARRLDEGFAEQETKEVHTAAARRDYVIKGLQHEAENATSDAARVRAFELLGKTIAMFADRVQQEEPDTRTPAEIRETLEAKLKLMFDDAG